MPVTDCTREGQPGFKWGESGHCYIYTAGNDKSREAARQACLKQAAAIEISKHAQHFRATLQHMTDAEILPMLDKAAIDRIRATDPKPVVRVYGIGHEGDATGNMIGTSHKLFRYVQHAVKRMFDCLKSGTAIFNRHADDNTHEGREQIGEVVGKAIRDVGGRLLSMAAVYLYPKYRDINLDVASIEANVLYKKDDDGTVAVTDVEEITGIALSSKDVDLPGFPGATLLGAMQAFNNYSKEGIETMTLEDIRKAISEGNYKPGDIFGKEVLVADAVVVDAIKAAKQTEYEHARRVEERLGQEREARMADQKKFEEDLGKVRGELVKASSSGLFVTLATERKLDDRQRKFVESNLADFKTDATDDAGVRKDLNSFIDRNIDKFRNMADIFGVKLDGGQQGGGQGDQGGGSSNAGAASSDKGEGSKPATNPNDLTDPKNNPFIP